MTGASKIFVAERQCRARGARRPACSKAPGSSTSPACRCYDAGAHGSGRNANPRTRTLLYPLLLLGGIALAVVLRLLPHRLGAAAARAATRSRLLFNFDVDTLQNALGNMAQVVAAVLGIVITVVSIVVQLAATRYTPRIADMFFRDRTNLGVLGFFVVACINAVWVSVSVGARRSCRGVSIVFTMVLVTASACS